VRPAPVRPRALLRRLASDESGFTLVELLSAMLVVSIGVIALLMTFDTSRNLVSFSEAKETAVHVAEQELERLEAIPYGQLELAAPGPQDCSPSPCASPNELAFYVGPTGWYRWDQTPTPTEAKPAPRCAASGSLAAPITNCERLVIDDVSEAVDAQAGAVPATRDPITTPTPSGGARLTLELQRFVTWADDDCARTAPGAVNPLCSVGQDYKRITVAVRIVRADSSGRLEKGPKQPVVLSTVMRP
jgi:prepilin-type N-terminal cleavage/methylation domain-containing protein